MLRRRFLVLLVLLVLVLVVHPLALDGGPAHTLLRVLINTVFAVAMWNIFRTRRSRTIGLVLGLPIIIARIANQLVPDLNHSGVALFFNFIAFAFLCYAVAMIVYAVYSESHLTREAIYGALCGFLLIGGAFGHFYYCIDWLDPADFGQQTRQADTASAERAKEALFMYYSFSSLIGKDDPDLSPKTDAARSIALTEAVIGQFYILVVLSELISLRVSYATLPTPARDDIGA